VQNWQFWVALLVPLAVAIFFAIRHSLHIRAIEEEITGDLDLDVGWQSPDDKGTAACMLTAVGDNLKDVRIVLPSEKREIGLLELHKSKRQEFQGVTNGTQYTISFKDPATGRKHTQKRIVRFQ